MNYKDIDWNEEMVISKAINNIIDLKRNYFNLQQQNHQLKDRIEKAIEYIKIYTERDYLEYHGGYKNVIESEKILTILKGEQND